ncbi:MAG: leucine-rich repeat protein, partial [Parasporobacterium sp.]|nr:leucine-rich repeat protein [Parasporobacterium sp.]
AVIEDGVKKIGSNAFNGCTNLTEVVVPDSVASIGANAFLGCTSLTAISVPDQVRYIDQSAFNGCSQLTTISLPNSVTKIVYYAFQNCTSLESIDLPVSVKAINSGAFYGCDSLADVNYGGTESDRNQMVIGGNNEPLLNATWHYLEASGIYSLNTHEIITCVGYPKELYFMGEDEADRLEGMWESSDSGVAYYDEERGCVVAERPGEAIISYTSLDGEYSDECVVTVYEGLDRDHLIFRHGADDDPVQLFFLDPYGEAVEGNWSCDDPDVATVSESGLVTPVGVGTTTVYFEFEAGDLAAECEITVMEPRYELNFREFRIAAGRQRACFTFHGPDGNEIDGIWESSNPDVAVVEVVPEYDMAWIRGLSLGTATITYTTSDGKYSDTCEVTVIRGMNYHDLILKAGGDGVQLSYAGVDGTELTDAMWISSDPDVATVSNGFVTPLGEGKTSIQYYGNNPNVDFDYCMVTVINGQINYEWDEEQCTCTAKLTRSVDQAVVETETVTCAVDVISAVSCDTDGEMLLTAVFTKPVFGTQTKTVIIPSPGHRLTKTDAVEATYESEGNIEYWTCSICGRHFSDEAGTNEISLEDTVTPKLVRTGWQQIDGKWYYYNTNGIALTGWQKIGSKWYYLGTDGVMKTGWVKVSKSWYYMNSSGVMQTGWKKVSGKWYYLGTNGVMRTGWQEVSGSRYYLGTDGIMRTGWQKVSESWYYLGTDGVMRTGWQKVDEKWYYLGTDGVRTTGWQKISKKWYYMGTDGVMATGWKKISKKWYYFGTDGVMCTGWKKISSKWYYFNSSGVMVTGTQTIGGKSYTFGSDGVWIEK